MMRVSFLPLMCALAFLSGAIVPEPKASEASPPDAIELSGDFRYRHDLVDEEGKVQRNRHRIRARLGLDARLADQLGLTFRLASGGSDPVSTMQTLSDGFTTKPVGIDLAYVEWRPVPVPGLSLAGGKMKNPYFRPAGSQLIWDSDLTPEGLAVQYNAKTGSLGMFATAAYLWVQERSKQKDSGMPGGQVGLKVPLPIAKSSVTAGVGYLGYLNAKGWPTFSDTSNGFGNTVDASKLYTADFRIVEAFAEVGFEAADLPVVLAGDYVNNTGASTNNRGWIAGFAIGRATAPGSWQLSYMYRRVEPDAVVGAFSDSDFRGGGTDAKGHTLSAEYCIASRVTTGVAYHDSRNGLRSPVAYRRLLVDVNFSF